MNNDNLSTKTARIDDDEFFRKLLVETDDPVVKFTCRAQFAGLHKIVQEFVRSEIDQGAEPETVLVGLTGVFLNFTASVVVYYDKTGASDELALEAIKTMFDTQFQVACDQQRQVSQE